MAVEYEGTVDVLKGPFGSAGEHAWTIAHDIVAGLKALPTAPWTTRGSSINGSAGNVYSATPDGVDRWAGKTQAQAVSSPQFVWHVLENSKTGTQICIRVSNDGGLSTIQLAVAPAKFETGGSWRGGGSSSSIRPQDITSLPAEMRECATFGGASLPPLPSGAVRMQVLGRKDGKGFVAYTFPETDTPLQNYCLVAAAAPITHPRSVELNPYIALVSDALDGAWFTSTPNVAGTDGTTIAGRTAAGSHVFYTFVPPGLTLATSPGTMDDSDPWTSAKRGWPLMTWTNSVPDHFRLFMPDIYFVDRSHTDKVTWGGKRYLKLYNWLFPWDGATAKGVDVAFDPLEANACPECPTVEEEPVPPSTPNFVDNTAEDELGVDIDAMDDIPPGFELARGRRNVANACVRRLITDTSWLSDQTGDVAGADYGENIRKLLNMALTTRELAEIGARAQAQLEQDDRVARADVTATFTSATSTLTLDIAIELAEGSFSLVLAISELTVELLQTA